MRVLHASFGLPRGLAGRLGGRLMAHGNAATERHLAQLASLGPDDAVVVLGPGPGVGLRAAGELAGLAVGIDPSDVMRAAAARRCAALVTQGRVRVEPGTAARTGLRDASADVVLTVNNLHLWPDRDAGFAELHRVLRPGGRLLLSDHRRWLPGGEPALVADVERAGFRDVETWSWEPPGRAASTAVQLRAGRPHAPDGPFAR